MTSTTIERALHRLGELVDYYAEVEILLVGGAAGMLTGVFPPSRTTTDCDIMVYVPPQAMTAVESAAKKVAAEMALGEHWLNSNVQLRRDVLTDGWERRRIWIGGSGVLRVWAASRLDLIVMKVIAGRPVDLEDLRDMRVRTDEVGFVRECLRALTGKGTPQDQVDSGLAVLASLRTHEHE